MNDYVFSYLLVSPTDFKVSFGRMKCACSHLTVTVPLPGRLNLLHCISIKS